MDVKTALNNAEAKGLLELQIVLIDSKQQWLICSPSDYTILIS